MKEILIVFFLLLISTPVFANNLTKIKCECVYGEKITENFKTKEILNRDTSLINKKNTLYFYINNEQKKIYDGERKLRKVISFTPNTIIIFDVTKLSDNMTNGEIWKLDRNTGYIEGSIIFEKENTRTTTGVYGECSITKDAQKF